MADIYKHFYMPNYYIDNLSYYLTANEFRVLMHMTREILGWDNHRESRMNTVAFSQLVKGVITKDGSKRCFGCGLKRWPIQQALQSLCQFGIIEKVKRTPQGCIYKLNFETDMFDMEGLKTRKAAKNTKNKGRSRSNLKQFKQ